MKYLVFKISIFLSASFIFNASYFFCSAVAAESPPADRVPFATILKGVEHSFPGKIKTESLEKEKGRWVYKFDILERGSGKIRHVAVDAMTGRSLESGVVKTESEE
jgi:uncharacterized membrane protein YkoI